MGHDLRIPLGAPKAHGFLKLIDIGAGSRRAAFPTEIWTIDSLFAAALLACDLDIESLRIVHLDGNHHFPNGHVSPPLAVFGQMKQVHSWQRLILPAPAVACGQAAQIARRFRITGSAARSTRSAALLNPTTPFHAVANYPLTTIYLSTNHHPIPTIPIGNYFKCANPVCAPAHFGTLGGFYPKERGFIRIEVCHWHP